MASSVLGKRLRNGKCILSFSFSHCCQIEPRFYILTLYMYRVISDNGFAIPLRSSKRRAKAPPQPQIHEVEDENDEPSISQNTSCKSRRGLRSLTTTTTKSNPIPIRNVRSKHTVPDKTVDESISPSNATITGKSYAAWI